MRMVDNQRGMVLLLVLVVVALLSALLSEFAFSTLVDLRLTETFRDTTRADYLARGGQTVGRMLLQEDRNGYDSPDDPVELWAQGVTNYPVAEGAVSIEIHDLDGRLDLNRLVDAQGNPNVVLRGRFERLCEQLGLDDPPGLTDAVIDWLDEDDVAEELGAESDYYLGLQPPYPSANGPLTTPLELQRVRGFDRKSLTLLLPFITVYGGDKLNINSAPREILLAWDEEMTEEIAETVLAGRADAAYKSIDQLRDILGVDNFSILNRNLDLVVTSQYYHIASRGEVGAGVRRLEAIVNKQGNRLLWQKAN